MWPNTLSGLGAEFMNIFVYFILRRSLCTGVAFHKSHCGHGRGAVVALGGTVQSRLPVH